MSTTDATIRVGLEDNATAGLKQLSNSLDTAEGSAKKTELSYKQLATGLSGVVTGAFSLYMAFDRAQDMTLAVDKANLKVATSTRGAEEAQDRYNKAVEKFGAGSTEAQGALTELTNAQERVRVATESAANTQESANQSMIQAALMVVPSVITAVSALAPILFAATGATTGLGAAQAILNAIMSANPVAIVILAIAGLVAILIAAYTYCEPFRNAVNALGAAIKDTLGKAFEIIMGVLSAFANAIGTVSNIVGGFVSAIGGWWTSITTTVEAQTAAQVEAIEAGCARQVEAIRKGMADQLAEVEAKTAELLATEQKRYDEETAAAIKHWTDMIEPPQSGWDAIIETVNQKYDQMITDAGSKQNEMLEEYRWMYGAMKEDVDTAYKEQIDATNTFYDEMLSVTSEKLASIRDKRSEDLDNLELNYLLQKAALDKSLAAHTISQTTFDDKMKALETKYRGERSDISDAARIEELRAESENKDNIEKVEIAKAADIEKIETDHTAAVIEIETGLATEEERIKNETMEAVIKIEGDRTDMVGKIRETEAGIEKTHAGNVATITTDSENAKKEIVRVGEEAINTLVGQKQDDLKSSMATKDAALNTQTKTAWETIASTIGTAFGAVKDKLTSIWTGITNWWGGLTLPKIDAPVVEAPVVQAPLVTGTAPTYYKVPGLQSAYEKPVLVTKPTLALIGEKQPEWVGGERALKREFSGGGGGGGGGGGVSIVVNVTGNTFANELDVKKAFESATRQMVVRLQNQGLMRIF